MSPKDLAQVLSQLPQPDDPNLLVGPNTADDAAAYKIKDDLAIVQTVDFFTPTVDDPYHFGEIAAANSLSDIYAMGCKPLFALNIVGFPASLPMEILSEILQGGANKAREAGISVIGGHTIDDKEPKYGMVVTAIARPSEIITNASARVGDVLVLTKPLGIGIINTAIKEGIARQETIDNVIKIMTTLNKYAAEAMIEVGINSCTDITGFGLLGHLHEMTEASKVGAEIRMEDIPIIPETMGFIKKGVLPALNKTTLEFLQDKVEWEANISEEEKLILSDPQTSGGLLISVEEVKAERLKTALQAKGVPVISEIGRIIEDKDYKIRVKF
ncbi:MAG: selenide, water dikinase SelD [Nitrospinae bacterium]|nr:selenide, water dikinase SelD [Nitrospinota bacterium]